MSYSIPFSNVGYGPENYYQMAVHCFSSGLCVAQWSRTEEVFDFDKIFKYIHLISRYRIDRVREALF